MLLVDIQGIFKEVGVVIMGVVRIMSLHGVY